MLLIACIAVVVQLSAGDNTALWDPRYAKLLGRRPGDPVIMNGGNHNDGRWECPWHLDWFQCADGNFFCKCPTDKSEIRFGIGCCYSFPSCGNMCNNWSCYRYRNCQTCRSWVSEWNMNACSSCKKGFVYEGGLCDRDLNECATRNGGCEQKCTNTYGSYFCTCHHGFSLKDDRHSCLRLACQALSDTPGVTVKPTLNWLFASFATFSTVERAFVLEGPYARECLADANGLRWDNIQPKALDPCSRIEPDEKRSCGDGASKDKCLQLGCCYQDVATDPPCYINIQKSYVRYGGVRPKDGLDNGIRQYKNYGVGSCSHMCLSNPSCRSFGIRHKGRNDTHNVNFQDCILLPKTKPEYEDSNEEQPDMNYDMYNYAFMAQEESGLTEKDDSIKKQYIGCFKEVSMSRDFEHYVGSSVAHMDVSMCIKMCRLQGYTLAGLQRGDQCYCSNSINRKYGPSERCVSSCAGDVRQKCGGADANSVYSVTTSDTYRGCYKDEESNRDLPILVWGQDSGHSAQDCIYNCSVQNYAYAGVQNGGACYCGNDFGSRGAADESKCYVKCENYARQNCGGDLVNAIYKTNQVAAFNTPKIPSGTVRLYDTTDRMNGMSTSIFTLYPNLRSILSKRLVIHSESEIIVPGDATCGSDCYKPCGEIYYDERLSNKGSDVTLRFFYVKLSDITKYVGSAAQRVSVYAQTVLIDSNLKFDFALSVRTKELIIDRLQAQFIEVSLDAKPFDIDVTTEKFSDPEPELLHQKQSIMCARMLLETRDKMHINTAYSILTSVAMTSSARPEARALAATARNLVAELSGVKRENIHYVPFYKKSHLSNILDTYYEEITIYKRDLDRLVDSAETKEEVLDFVEGLQKICSDTNIAEAKTAYDAALDAVDQGNATYQRFQQEYEQSYVELEEARQKFEDALTEMKYWKIAPVLLRFLLEMREAAAGEKTPDDEAKSFIKEEDFDGMFQLMKEINKITRQVNAIGKKADKIFKTIKNLEDEFDGRRYLDEIELTVQLQASIIQWQNLKNEAEAILSDEEVAAVRGCPEYHRALLNLCNWGEALTRSTVEYGELMRESAETRAVFDLRTEQMERIEKHIEECRDGVFSVEGLVADVIEQSYDVRVDLNNALLTFCQAYFYENMFDCKPSYRPAFGGTLTDLLLKVNSARRDDLLVGSAPSTVQRHVTIRDTNTSALCMDPSDCPISYLRQTRTLSFRIPVNHPALADMDAYKVIEIVLRFNGVGSKTDKKYLKVLIESSGDFQGQASGQVYNFLTRTLSIAFEYDIDSLHTSIHADVYHPYRNIIQHITPYTTWVMRVSDARSRDIDLSNVTSVRVEFHGSGVNNETWERKRRAAEQG